VDINRLLEKPLHERSLATACLTGNKTDLAVSRQGTFQALIQLCQLAFASYENLVFHASSPRR
jgi:hypothetical protein